MIFTRLCLADDKREMRLVKKSMAEYKYREERISNYGSSIELRKGFYLLYLRSYTLFISIKMSSSIKRLLKLMKRNPKPTASAFRVSAALPSSGITFVDNSQGASAAVAELSDALNAVLEQIDLDGECLCHIVANGSLRDLLHRRN